MSRKVQVNNGYGGSLQVKTMKRLIDNSYQRKDAQGKLKLKEMNIDGFMLDKDLTDDTSAVYYNPVLNQVVHSVRGTNGTLKDWANNAVYLASPDAYQKLPRYLDAARVQKEINQKYKDAKRTMVTHSQSGIIGRYQAKLDPSLEVISLNPASGWKDSDVTSPNEFVVKSTKDLVSLLHKNQPQDTIIKGESLNQYKEHDIGLLDRLDKDKYIGQAFGNTPGQYIEPKRLPEGFIDPTVRYDPSIYGHSSDTVLTRHPDNIALDGGNYLDSDGNICSMNTKMSRCNVNDVKAHVGGLKKQAMNLYSTKKKIYALGGALCQVANLDDNAGLYLAKHLVQNSPGDLPIEVALQAARDTFGAPADMPEANVAELSGGGFFDSLWSGVKSLVPIGINAAATHIVNQKAVREANAAADAVEREKQAVQLEKESRAYAVEQAKEKAQLEKEERALAAEIAAEERAERAAIAKEERANQAAIAKEQRMEDSKRAVKAAKDSGAGGARRAQASAKSLAELIRTRKSAKGSGLLGSIFPVLGMMGLGPAGGALRGGALRGGRMQDVNMARVAELAKLAD